MATSKPDSKKHIDGASVTSLATVTSSDHQQTKFREWQHEDEEEEAKANDTVARDWCDKKHDLRTTATMGKANPHMSRRRRLPPSADFYEVEDEELKEDDDQDRDLLDADTSERASTRDSMGAAVIDSIMPRLTPVRVHPKRLSKATASAMFLTRIESIEVLDIVENDTDEALYYIMNVYCIQEQMRIPTNRHQQRPDRPFPMHRQPDFQVARRYSEFETLRTRICEIAQRSHGADPDQRPWKWKKSTVCQYCDHVLAHFASSRAQPNLRLKFLTSKHKRKSILTQFLNGVVELIQSLSHLSTHSVICQGHEQIPMLVRRFLQQNRTLPTQ